MRDIRCFFLDMDGTIYLGNRLIEGTLSFLQAVRSSGRKFIFLTNNSSKSGQMYREKLLSMGIEISENELLTSGQAAAKILLRDYPGKKIWVLGNTFLKQELSEMGVALTESSPDMVLTAFDTELTYQKLRDCCDYVREGLPYIATHPDLNCPTETGFMPDLGSFAELIYASTSRYPDRVIGKPERDIFECASRLAGIPLSYCAMCGDRLYTDIRQKAGTVQYFGFKRGNKKRRSRPFAYSAGSCGRSLKRLYFHAVAMRAPCRLFATN